MIEQIAFTVTNGMVKMYFIYLLFCDVILQDQRTLAAVMIMMEYLTDTAVAPLQRDFVELSEPYCSNVR